MIGEAAGRRRARVAVTRTAIDAAELLDALIGCGLDAVGVPLIDIVPPRDGGEELVDSIEALESDDWLIVLSPNGARAVVDLVADDVNVGVVGSRTAAVFEERGRAVDLVADPPTAVDLAKRLLEVIDERRTRVLIAQAESGLPDVHDALVAAGVRVERVVTYRNIEPASAAADVVAAGVLDAVIFASPSAVDRWFHHRGADPGLAVAFGPTTARAATERGFTVVTARAPTVDGVAEATLTALDQVDS